MNVIICPKMSEFQVNIVQAVAQQGGGQGGHLPLGAALWGRQIEVEILHKNYEMSTVNTQQMLIITICKMSNTSADTWLRNLIKITKVCKGSSYEP